jgi:GT2 family glycosyltransferase
MNPRVAVIVVNYNAGKYLARCLDALAKQTYGNTRTIVVDNASTDGSADEVAGKFPGVQVVKMPRNVGFAAGNNAGIMAAEDCDWIALINPDAFAEPDWVSELVAGAQRHSAESFFGSRMLQANAPDRLDGTGDVYHVSGVAWRRDHGCLVAEEASREGEIFGPCAAAAMYPRAALLEIGGFDESYFCYYEDVDLAFRLRLKGYRCWYLPRAVVHHVGSAITGHESPFTTYHVHRNLVWTYIKNMPGILFWVYLPQHLLVSGWLALKAAFRGHAATVLKAKWHAARRLAACVRERRLVQATRTASIADVLQSMARGYRALRRGGA